MGLARIGPVAIAWDGHLNPSFRFTSQVDPAGLRDAEISGFFDWDVAEQLSELVANTDASPTIGGRKGPLVPIWADDAKLQQFVGLYVLESFQLEADQPSSLSDAPVAGTLQACYVDLTVRDYVLTHSAVPKGNDFSLTAKSTVVSPFRPSDDAGEEFLTPPGGTYATRAYDPTSIYDPTDLTPDDAAAIGFYVGTVTDADDDIASVTYPQIAWTGSDEPLWLSQQGGDVRAYDRRAGREVYGPHPFLDATDIIITNGLVRAWIGNRGLNPFLSVWVFRTGTWRYKGTVRLSTTNALVSARVVTVTPELAEVAIQVANEGTVLIGLQRGSRRLDVAHGDGSVSTSRVVEWFNSPPVSFLGIVNDLYDDIYADSYGGALAVVFSWPPAQSIDEWSLRARWSPDAASASQGTSGILSVFSAAGTQAASVWWDSADKKMKAEVGTTTVMSSALTFSAAQVIGVVLRFSTTEGMALTVDTGTPEHVSDATQLTPGATDYDRLGVGYAPGGSWSTTAWNNPGGTVSDIAIVADRLTDSEAASFVSGSGLVGEPSPEGRVIWYSPTVPDTEAPTGTYTSGRVVEAADGNGLARGVAALDSGVSTVGVGLALSAVQALLSAFVATSGTADTAADHHGQFAAESTQQVRVR